MPSRDLALAQQKYSVHFRDDTDSSVIYEVLQSQEYKICADRIRQATGVIIDIGAHIGTFVLYAYALNQQVSVYAYEPDPDNYQLLKTNVKDNRLQKVETKQQAVSGTAGEVLLHLSDNNHNNSLQTPYSAAKESTVKVHATTLDKIFSKNRIEHCSLLKIDCEGAEYDIFENTSEETFKKIDAIIMEYHEHAGRQSKELVSILQKHGFRVKMQQKSPYSATLGVMYLTK